MTTKLSVFILAYNSEDKIEGALKSVQWADEVVVIDSHSVDRTAEIAAKYGAKLVQVDFEGFGKLRLAGIANTTHDWIFSLDTDERREKMLAMLGEEDRLISKIRDEWERKSHLSGQERWAVLTKHVRAEKKPKLGAVRA